jgi:hypothetical protein
MYLGGYAVECALVALICFQDRTTDFRDTRAFKSGIQGAEIHKLSKLIDATPRVKNAITLDATGQLRNAWNLVAGRWQYEKLRYYDKVGIGERIAAQRLAEDFIAAVERIQGFLMQAQGE